MSEFTDTKSAWESSTIRAAVVGMLVTAIALVKSLFNIDLGLVNDDIQTISYGVIALVVGVKVIIGRLKANTTIGTPPVEG